MSTADSPLIVQHNSDLDSSTFETLVVELGRADTLQTFSVFFDEADKRLMRLRELSCDNWESIAQEAHGLKGSAGNFGLRQVSELAAVLEQDARTVTPVRYEAALRVLETSYATAHERFAELAGQSNP